MTLVEFLHDRISEDENAAIEWRDHDAESTRFGTHRIMAECASKRLLVGMHSGCDDWSYGDSGTCPELRALAVPYSDHPDYDEIWRP